MQFFRGLTRKKQSTSSASAKKGKKEYDCYLNNGGAVLEEILALCNGNCRIPIRYFSATDIERAIKHSENKLELSGGYMVTGSLEERLVLVRFNTCDYNSIHRDIAITSQMSHLKNVLRLIGCCLEFEEPVMVYEYVEARTLDVLLCNINDHARKPLTWENRLRIANEVASALVFLHTEFTTPIIHTDMKPLNVIIDQNSGVAKLLNFSQSVSLPPGELEVSHYIIGTLEYLSPEYALLGSLTQKNDVYSFGVLLFHLLIGKEMRWEETNVMAREDSAITEETIYFEEDAKSNIEEGNSMDRVDSAIPAEPIDFENLPPNLMDIYVKEGNIMDIVDPAILEEHGIEIRQQLEDYLYLVKKCTAMKGDYRPYMIHVARELRRIEKCSRALTICQN